MSLLTADMGKLPSAQDLAKALSDLPPAAPVVIMLHGFKFDPDKSDHSPHNHILSLSPKRCWKAVSWPRRLGLKDDGGLAIAFGWAARGSIWSVTARAEQASAELARLITTLHRLDPERPLHLVGHSLGGRVALRALTRAPAGSVNRVLLLHGAIFAAEAKAWMMKGAARTAEVCAIQGAENTLFDLLFRLAFPLAGPTIGRRGPTVRNWCDLPLDRPETRDRLNALGFRIAPARARICHWSGYLRPGVFGFYRQLLQSPERLPLELLRAHVSVRTAAKSAIPIPAPLRSPSQHSS